MATPRLRKVAVVGARSVGKSSLTVQFVEQHFVESYYPTIESQFSKSIRYKGQNYNIEILDTAGQDEYSIINEKHLVGIHGYLLVYSVTSRYTFDMISIVMDKILNYTGSDHVPAILVGNKSDLHMQRQVTEEEGKELAAKLKCGFVETSARHNDNITRSFELLVTEIEKINNPQAPDDGQKCIVQ